MSESAPPPLLEVKDLTLRFRGLTAVNDVSLHVNPGEIVAVIGPNGAGKTSLFNAITGIYEPTEGTISLEGQDLQEAPERANLVRWCLVGLAVGLLFALWASNPNQLWSAVVKNNFRNAQAGFQWSHAFDDLGDFIRGEPRIELATGRFHVTTAAGEHPFGSCKTREDAEIKRKTIPKLAALDPATATLQPVGDKVAILDAAGALIDYAPNASTAQDRIRAAHAVAHDARAALWQRLFAFIFGCLIGYFAARAIWQQTRRTPTSVALRGIARTFQNIRLFADMTARDNVLVARDRDLGVPHRFWSKRRLFGDFGFAVGLVLVWLLFVLGQRLGFFPEPVLWTLWALLGVGTLVWVGVALRRGFLTPSARTIEARESEEALELLRFVGLEARADDFARNLPYGDQRRLEIARALATRPKLLLLDEPAAGMNPSETGALTELIRRIRDRGVTVLLIEHHMRVVMGISDRIAVLVYGQKIAEGTPEAIQKNPQVIQAYLGEEELG